MANRSETENDEGFKVFLAKSKALHLERHPTANVNWKQFQSLALEKFENLDEETKAIFRTLKTDENESETQTSTEESSSSKIDQVKKPKRISPFMLFSKTKRVELKSANPNLTVIENFYVLLILDCTYLVFLSIPRLVK